MAGQVSAGFANLVLCWQRPDQRRHSYYSWVQTSLKSSNYCRLPSCVHPCRRRIWSLRPLCRRNQSRWHYLQRPIDFRYCLFGLTKEGGNSPDASSLISYTVGFTAAIRREHGNLRTLKLIDRWGYSDAAWQPSFCNFLETLMILDGRRRIPHLC